LPTALHAQLTELPPALVPLLRDTVRAWLAPATPTTASPTGLSAVAQARALEAVVDAHLRLDAQAAGPRGSDPTRWSLEQHRASALVLTSDFILLGRALGLPLRLAEGYLPSDFDTETQVHEVRARDATDWAQLAVAGLGWLDLFPAAHQLAAALPPPSQVHTLPTPAPWPTASAAPTATPQAANAPLRAGVPAAAPRARGSGPAQPWPLLVLIGVAGVVALLLARRRWRWQRFLARLTPLARFFARLARLARLAGLELRPSDTAAQATAKVVAAVVPEDAATHTTTRTTLLTLNGFYERLRYGPPGSALGGWPDLRAAWADLRGRLWRRALAGPWRPRRSSSRHHTARRQ